MDITDGRLGEFDYVISHGVYAWIPAAARDALLAAVKAHLAPDGIAYVSYNAHPGGYLRRLLREAALWHSRDERPGPEQAEKARELFEFLEIRVAEDPYGGMLGMEVPCSRRARSTGSSTTSFRTSGAPVWFHEFASAAAGHGLAVPRRGQPARAVAAELSRTGVEQQLDAIAGGDRIAREQYQDLLLFRRFRSTMLCHEGTDVAERLLPDTLRTLLFTARPPERGRPGGPAAPRAAAARRRAAGGDPVRGAARRSSTPTPTSWSRRSWTRCATRDRPARRPAGARAGGRRAAAGERAGALADRAPARGHDAAARGGADRRRRRGRPCCGLLDGTRTRDEIRRDLAAAGGPELAPEQLDLNLRSLGELGLLHE